MNAIKTKNTKVGSFFLKAWVFSAARKKILSSHTHWAVHVQSLLWKILFLGILLEDFKADASVFVTITQMKPERCKKAEKEQKPYKSLQHNLSSNYVSFPSLCWVPLTENFPCGGSQRRRVSWWSFPLRRESCQRWMWDEGRFWPSASPKIRPAREANWDGAHCFCPACKPSL